VRWYVAKGMMPNIEDPLAEKIWKNSIENNTKYDNSFPTREAALVAAHDLAKKTSILEYGVIEI
jgi:hypothetical protein